MYNTSDAPLLNLHEHSFGFSINAPEIPPTSCLTLRRSFDFLYYRDTIPSPPNTHKTNTVASIFRSHHPTLTSSRTCKVMEWKAFCCNDMEHARSSGCFPVEVSFHRVDPQISPGWTTTTTQPEHPRVCNVENSSK